jgi:hypothetical protein
MPILSRHVGRRALLLASGAAAITSPAVWAAGASVMIDFSGVPVGQLPTDFMTARTGSGAVSVWVVQEDASAEGGRVLAQTSTDQTDYRFPLAIYEKLSPANVDISVRFRAVGGRVDRAGGIAVRLTDASNYYVVRANALEDNVNFYRVVQGSRREISGSSTKVASGVWHLLGLRAEGDNFVISFNGKTLFTAKDATFANAGKVALWTKADSVTHFHSLKISTLA